MGAVVVLATVRWALRRSAQLLIPDAPFLVWNSVLAIVPALFALPLSRAPRRTTAWWLGVVMFVLFLPNAPYVLTDVVHMLDRVRGGASNQAVVGVYAPVYAAFFAFGFGIYVLCLRVVRSYVGAEWGRRAVVPVILTLHGMSAVGIYLGRIVRLNSWDAVTAPNTVAGSVQRLSERVPAATVAATFVGLVLLTTLADACVDGLRARWEHHSLL